METSKKKLISVIVPVYNVEEYLDVCVQSIIQQTYQNLEIILVDDGSLDRSSEKCDEWSRKDTRILVIHKENGGLSAARNTGIEMAKGEYISFIDSDDFIEKDMLDTMLSAAQRFNAEIVCCGRKRMISKDVKIPLHCLDAEKVYNKEQAMKEVLLGRDIEEAAWDKLYKAELFLDIRYPEGEINEDIPVIGPLLSKCTKVVHVGKPFYNYRVNQNSITKSQYSEKKSVYLEHMQQVYLYFMTNYPQLRKEVEYFLARYAYAVLLDMEMDKKIVKKFQKDYQEYKRILSKNYKTYFNDKTLTHKTRMQVRLILAGLYGPLIRAKKSILK